MKSHGWVPAAEAWAHFIDVHPELGYRPGKWQFHNFLRLYRDVLVNKDAIRLAKKRFWIAHLTSFVATAFDAATGRTAANTAIEQGAVSEGPDTSTKGSHLE